MVLDSKIDIVRDAFNIHRLDDWTRVETDDIVALHGVGDVTLQHIRLYLAGQGRTLHNDRTPGYWLDHLGTAKVGQQISDEDKSIIFPCAVLIDTAETQPFTFHGLRCDADQQHRPLIVKTEWRALGRHPDSLGDYSLDGYVGRCHVERKSVKDFQGTLMEFGQDGRRERFESELSNLEKLEAAAVVVEGTLLRAITVQHEYGKKPSQEAAKLLMRSVLAYQQDYDVPWLFCDDRRMAEVATFRFLERFWRKDQEKRKEAERMLAGI